MGITSIRDRVRRVVRLSRNGSLHSVGKAGKRKVPHFHIWYEEGATANRADSSADPVLLTKRFEVIQHDDGALVEPEVLHRVFDLSVLDIEDAIAGEAR